MFNRFLILSLIITATVGLTFSQTKYQSREEKLEQLKRRSDIKVTEVEKDIIKIEYPNGKVMYKNIGEYQRPTTNSQQPLYSPTFDSTIIDLTTIDTTLYYHKYSFWQEVPLHNWDFDFLRIGDVNNNRKPELYGVRKFFYSVREPITVYELNETGSFDSIYQYDSVYIARSIYDVDKDGKEEVLLTLPPLFDTVGNQQRFFSKENDSSLATQLNFAFTFSDGSQLDDITLGEFDGDQNTDLLFDRISPPYVYIFEHNSILNNFDSVYRFQVPDPIDLGIGGYSVGDFDIDGKTDIVFSTVRGKVFVIENEGDNQYMDVWLGSVESNNAYVHTWTNDIDKNGKPEFWVLADSYYNGIGTTRITIFETNGDNSYQAVGRIDLVGIMSFYAGNMQAIDVDGDGTEEVAICIDDNFLILKFSGSKNHHTYEVYYIKKNELSTEEEYQVYFGAIMYDLQNDGDHEILISMAHTIQEPNIISRGVTKIYRPDSLTSVISNDIVPNSIKINQNYPNPFNPSTTIKFELNQLSNISIKVFNILGKEIKTLLEKELSPGVHKIDWEAEDSNNKLLPSGVYLIRLTAGKYTHSVQALLLK
ncbi:T9SS type A sorting domain-containing protein [Ignavibacterium album]|uniref:T9SS type A sorting domain-containing protein n=1 Tax=Ignavibacterium album TaxID=591197 RepID=UPI0035B9D686